MSPATPQSTIDIRQSTIEMVLVVAAALAGPAAPRAYSQATFTASSANVAAPGVGVKIHIQRWSTDEDRDRLAAALSAPARGGGSVATGRVGGGPGPAGRGRSNAPTVPLTPIQRLARAITAQPTIGYIWTNEVTGYAVKYAYRLLDPAGGERIIMATDRRLGGYSDGWRPIASAAPPPYDFTVLELRLGAKGAGEAVSSLTTPVAVDSDSKSISLENAAPTSVVLRNIKRQQSGP